MRIFRRERIVGNRIGVGTDGNTLQPEQTPLGIEMKSVKVSIDEKLLTEIATETGGKYFRAKDNEGLKNIYSTIDELEKSKVEIITTTKFTDKFLPFAIVALLFLFIEILLRLYFAPLERNIYKTSSY